MQRRETGQNNGAAARVSRHRETVRRYVRGSLLMIGSFAGLALALALAT